MWEITVSNKKIDEDTADLTHIVLEDELAGGMQYAKGAIDTEDNPVNGYSSDGGNTWKYDLDNYVTVNGSKFTIDFKDAVKLAPNQSILIHYASDLPTATVQFRKRPISIRQPFPPVKKSIRIVSLLVTW